MNSHFKYFITFIFVLIHPILSSFGDTLKEERFGYFLEGKEFNALIAVRGGMYSSEGYSTGYHYELLSKFSKDQRVEINIDYSQKDSMWSSLINGDLDIVVVSSIRDTIPFELADKVISSIEINQFDHVWVTKKEDINLLISINQWLNTYKYTVEFANLEKKYTNKRKNHNFGGLIGTISPYDNLIKKYSKDLGWDWRLLAALIYQESKFSLTAQSSQGAMGLMQVKSTTAEMFNISQIFDPEENIKAGTRYLKYLNRIYNNPNIDSLDRIKFVLASYNAGEGRVNDIRKTAILKGYNHNKWDSTRVAIQYMQDVEALPQGTLRHGPFIGKETIEYVDKVLERYEKYRLSVK